MVQIIAIGLIGLGFMGETHLQAYQQVDNCWVKTICSRSEEKGSKLAEYYETSFVIDYTHILADPDIDMIDISLPTHLHESFIIEAANAGKHIICEKPLTLTTASADRMVEAVQANNVRLFVGHVIRFWPEYALFESYQHNGRLHPIETIHAERLGQAPEWSNWFQDPNKSGGALFDLHIHDIDYISKLLGDVTSVYAVGHRNQYGAWDHVMTTITFQNGSNAYVEASHRMPRATPFTMSLRAQSSAAMLDFRFAGGENIEATENTKQHLSYITHEGVTPLEVDQIDPFLAELAYFVTCLDQDKSNDIVPLSDVLDTLAIVEAIETSLETGDIVHYSR